MTADGDGTPSRRARLRVMGAMSSRCGRVYGPSRPGVKRSMANLRVSVPVYLGAAEAAVDDARRAADTVHFGDSSTLVNATPTPTRATPRPNATFTFS